MKWIVTSRVNDGIERKECDTEEKLKSMVQLALRRNPQYVKIRQQNDRLIAWIISEIRSVLGIDFSREPMALEQIREEAERAEDTLSSSQEYEMMLPSIAVGAIGPQIFELSRERLAVDGVPIGKTWTVNWGNDGEFGRCDIIGQHGELLDFVSELMKRSPREVSIAAASVVPDRGDDFPYAAIAYALKNGDFVPFLGAGVSASARQPADTRWNIASNFPPTGSELSEFLASDNNFPSESYRDRADLARVASYSSTITPDYLPGTLRKMFHSYSKPGKVHEMIASVPKPLLIVTTNYDVLMEDALRKAGRIFDVVTHYTPAVDEPSSIMYLRHGEDPIDLQDDGETDSIGMINKIKLSDRTVVYKMHGSVDRFKELTNENQEPNGEKSWASFVITEEDYVEFLTRINATPPAVPAAFMKHFALKSFLFMGYGLRDWNFRVVLQMLKGSLPVTLRGKILPKVKSRRSHLAIQKKSTQADRALWDARDVKIRDCDLNIFAENVQRHL